MEMGKKATGKKDTFAFDPLNRRRSTEQYLPTSSLVLAVCFLGLFSVEKAQGSHQCR